MKRTLIIFAALAAAGSQAIVLDDFSTGPYAVSLQTGSDFATQNGSMIGGERYTYVEVESNPLNQFLDFTISGGFGISSSGALLDAYTEMGYGINADLNADLSTENAFIVHFVSNDLPMTMYVGVAGGGSGIEVVSMNLAGGTTFNVIVPFSMFTFNGWNDVDFIGFGFDTVTNGDFVIDKITTVPEPATMIALGAGLAGVLARRRRK